MDDIREDTNGSMVDEELINQTETPNRVQNPEHVKPKKAALTAYTYEKFYAGKLEKKIAKYNKKYNQLRELTEQIADAEKEADDYGSIRKNVNKANRISKKLQDLGVQVFRADLQARYIQSSNPKAIKIPAGTKEKLTFFDKVGAFFKEKVLSKGLINKDDKRALREEKQVDEEKIRETIRDALDQVIGDRDNHSVLATDSEKGKEILEKFSLENGDFRNIVGAAGLLGEDDSVPENEVTEPETSENKDETEEKTDNNTVDKFSDEDITNELRYRDEGYLGLIKDNDYTEEKLEIEDPYLKQLVIENDRLAIADEAIKNANTEEDKIFNQNLFNQSEQAVSEILNEMLNNRIAGLEGEELAEAKKIFAEGLINTDELKDAKYVVDIIRKECSLEEEKDDVMARPLPPVMDESDVEILRRLENYINDPNITEDLKADGYYQLNSMIENIITKSIQSGIAEATDEQINDSEIRKQVAVTLSESNQLADLKSVRDYVTEKYNLENKKEEQIKDENKVMRYTSLMAPIIDKYDDSNDDNLLVEIFNTSDDYYNRLVNEPETFANANIDVEEEKKTVIDGLKRFITIKLNHTPELKSVLDASERSKAQVTSNLLNQLVNDDRFAKLDTVKSVINDMISQNNEKLSNLIDEEVKTIDEVEKDQVAKYKREDYRKQHRDLIEQNGQGILNDKEFLSKMFEVSEKEYNHIKSSDMTDADKETALAKVDKDIEVLSRLPIDSYWDTTDKSLFSNKGILRLELSKLTEMLQDVNKLPHVTEILQNAVNEYNSKIEKNEQVVQEEKKEIKEEVQKEEEQPVVEPTIADLYRSHEDIIEKSHESTKNTLRGTLLNVWTRALGEFGFDKEVVRDMPEQEFYELLLNLQKYDADKLNDALDRAYQSVLIDERRERRVNSIQNAAKRARVAGMDPESQEYNDYVNSDEYKQGITYGEMKNLYNWEPKEARATAHGKTLFDDNAVVSEEHINEYLNPEVTMNNDVETPVVNETEDVEKPKMEAPITPPVDEVSELENSEDLQTEEVVAPKVENDDAVVEENPVYDAIQADIGPFGPRSKISSQQDFTGLGHSDYEPHEMVGPFGKSKPVTKDLLDKLDFLVNHPNNLSSEEYNQYIEVMKGVSQLADDLGYESDNSKTDDKPKSK